MINYRTQSIDTSVEVDSLMFSLLAQFSPTTKAIRTRNFNKALRQLVISAVKSDYPDATISEIKQEYQKRRYGVLEEYALFVNDPFADQLMINDPIALARQIADILEFLDIPYLVGGSIASSLLGESRATQDLNLVADIKPSQAQALVQAMATEFYISDLAVQEAISQKTSFNIIHLPSVEKADIFILGSDEFSISKMKRRQLHSIGEVGLSIYIYSPEDIILQKLRWYRLTNKQSQTQWRDVLGVIKIQRAKLDFNYLKEWAKYLNLLDLLIVALKEAGLDFPKQA